VHHWKVYINHVGLTVLKIRLRNKTTSEKKRTFEKSPFVFACFQNFFSFCPLGEKAAHVSPPNFVVPTGVASVKI